MASGLIALTLEAKYVPFFNPLPHNIEQRKKSENIPNLLL